MVDRASFTTTHLINLPSFVDQRVLSRKANRELPVGWTPDNWSVICGRGKDCYEHIGNRRFRVLVDANLQKYSAATSKVEKSSIVMSIFDAIIEGSNNSGGFVKQNPTTKCWTLVDDDAAREKIGQQFRIQLSQQKNNNNKQQKKQRRVPKSKQAMKKKVNMVKKDTPKQLEPTLFDEIADILDFEIDCNEDDLIHIMAATAWNKDKKSGENTKT